MIELSEAQLGKRQDWLRRTLRRLTRPHHPTISLVSTPQTVLLIAGARPSGESPRTAYQRTRIDGVLLNYYEAWARIAASGKFGIEKSYLHIDVIYPEQQTDTREMLAVHFDPRIPKTTPSFNYMRGPHLHASGWQKTNLSKRHISLCLQTIDQICTDIDQFADAFERAIQMIDDELLDHVA